MKNILFHYLVEILTPISLYFTVCASHGFQICESPEMLIKIHILEIQNLLNQKFMESR